MMVVDGEVVPFKPLSPVRRASSTDANGGEDTWSVQVQIAEPFVTAPDA